MQRVEAVAPTAPAIQPRRESRADAPRRESSALYLLGAGMIEIIAVYTADNAFSEVP